MDVDLEEPGKQTISKRWLFCGAGVGSADHPRIIHRTPGRLVHRWKVKRNRRWLVCSSGGFLGVGQRAARPYYQENIAGAEWVAVSNQFFHNADGHR